MPASVSKIGHIVLRVEDLDSALAFYCGVLGLKEVARRLHGPAGDRPGRPRRLATGGGRCLAARPGRAATLGESGLTTVARTSSRPAHRSRG
jgi:catechol 2,3-dioxygenase-like lactoylglutathione lyase family enzyme